MREFEKTISQTQEKYEQKLSKLESYYIEKGVNSQDFIAFENALKITVLEKQKRWFKKTLKLNLTKDLSGSAPGSDEHAFDKIITGINEAKNQKVDHEKAYPNFSALYYVAKGKIDYCLKNSPDLKQPVIDGLSSPYLGLLKARNNIINRPSISTSKAPRK